jgi:RNA polymerase sigma factor (sigma-70 family)
LPIPALRVECQTFVGRIPCPFHQLVRLRPQLVAYARSICSTGEEAEDLVQDAIERALKAAAPPVKLPDLRPWLFRIIRNLRIDDLRKAKVRAEYADNRGRLSDEGHHQDSDPLQDLLVRQAFRALSQTHREVIFLVDVMGMRYAEAAQVLDVVEGTIMSRLSRARQAMIERLKESNVTPLRRRQS